jgi:hypothetical protein
MEIKIKEALHGHRITVEEYITSERARIMKKSIPKIFQRNDGMDRI